MKAAVVQGPGQTPVHADFAEPVPAAGEVLVNVSAAAISQVVKARASGAHYSAANHFPFVAGIDGVGRTADGRRVYFVMPRAPYGTMAERVAVPATHCIAVPDDLDDLTAAAIANPGMSSWAAYVERARLKPGETVLVNGATGTSGRLAVRIARHLGAGKIIATGRNPETLRAVGADVAITIDQPDAFMAQFADGVDVVIDYLWGDSARALLIAGAKAGRDAVPIRFVQVGSVSGADIALPSAVLRSSAIELMGSGIGSIRLDRLMAAAGAVLQAAVPAGLRIAMTPAPLSDVEQAWPRDDSTRRTVFHL